MPGHGMRSRKYETHIADTRLAQGAPELEDDNKLALSRMWREIPRRGFLGKQLRKLVPSQIQLMYS